MLADSFYDCCMIRSAVRNDAAMAVPLILQAIGQIAFVLSGTAEAQETESILKDFFGQEGNRMSYQNTLVMEEDGEVVGVAIFYDGGQSPRTGRTARVGCREKSRGIPIIVSPPNRKRRSFTWIPLA